MVFKQQWRNSYGARQMYYYQIITYNCCFYFSHPLIAVMNRAAAVVWLPWNHALEKMKTMKTKLRIENRRGLQITQCK